MNDEDDDARYKYLAEGNARQARKRVASKILLRDQSGRILLVNPTYKEYWDIPGGMAEANESPQSAAQRELSEELSYTPTAGRLLFLEWVDAHGPWDDQLVFIFDGGTLSSEEINRMRISDSEISEFYFFEQENALRILRPDVARRLANAIASLGSDVCYVENHAP